ncbi:MAG: hypothetical protein KDH94_01010 [Coxiellaceae bacterium]|nr:hypothetical protein [Coxiellaceae bacterium]
MRRPEAEVKQDPISIVIADLTQFRQAALEEQNRLRNQKVLAEKIRELKAQEASSNDEILRALNAQQKKIDLWLSLNAPLLSDAVYQAALQVSTSSNFPVMQEDLRALLAIRDAKQAVEAASSEERKAGREHLALERDQKQKTQQLQSARSKYTDMNFAIQQYVEDIRRPFEQQIKEKREALEKAQTDLANAGTLRDEIEKLTEHNQADQRQQQEFSQLAARYRDEVQKTSEANQQLLQQMPDLPQPDRDQLDQRLEERKTTLTEVEQKLKKLEAAIEERNAKLAELRQQQQNLKKLPKEINKLQDWLAKNDLVLPSFNEDADPASLDAVIAKFEALQSRQPTNWIQKGINLVEGYNEVLDFDGSQVAGLVQSLKSIQETMKTIRQLKVEQQKAASPQTFAQTQAAQRSANARIEAAKQVISKEFAQLKQRLCDRELDGLDLIPDRNMFSQHLDEFERVLRKLEKLKKVDAELAPRINGIRASHTTYIQQYAQQLAAIAKPYKFGWMSKEQYHQQVINARTQLIEQQLKPLVAANNSLNERLCKHPDAFANLSRLTQVLVIAGSCLVIGLPVGIYFLAQNAKAKKVERRFERTTKAAEATKEKIKSVTAAPAA